MDEKELAAKKLADALNAASSAEMAAKETQAEVKEQTETLKSVVENLTEVTKKLSEKAPEESPAILEMKSELALLKAQDKASKKGFVGGSELEEVKKEYVEKSKPLVSSVYTAIKSAANSDNAQFTISSDQFEFNTNKFKHLQLKSIRSFDNTSAGGLLKPESSSLGLINDNPDLPAGVITSLVKNITRLRNEKYTYYDTSSIDLDESLIMAAKTEGQAFKLKEREITQRQFSTYSLVDDYLVHLAAAGAFQIDPIQTFLNELDRKFELKLDKAILTRIIERSQTSGTAINIAYTAGTTPVLADISNAVTVFPAHFTNGQIASISNMYMVVDAALTDQLFKSEGDDGHLKTEYYDYTIGAGIIAIKTGRGLLKLIPIDAQYFGTYKLFDDSKAATSSDNAAGYIAGGSNGGKVLGIVADWANAVALLRNPMSVIGIDSGLRYQLTTGTAVAGKIAYAGTDVFFERKISLLINKNS